MDIIDGIKFLMGLMMFNCEVRDWGHPSGCLPPVFLHFGVALQCDASTIKQLYNVVR